MIVKYETGFEDMGYGTYSILPMHSKLPVEWVIYHYVGMLMHGIITLFLSFTSDRRNLNTYKHFLIL